jgi:SPX domain protein involved in polyphosphate accumulation
MEQRVEKKFRFKLGDNIYKEFLLNSLSKKIYEERVVNSIYFDTENYKNLWDNINGFSDRIKVRIRWYNKLSNTSVYLEEKKKINFITQKTVTKLGTFKDLNELILYFENNKDKEIFFSNKNLKKNLLVSYDRNYFQTPNLKLRITVDKNIKIYNYPYNNFIDTDDLILEFKYDIEDSFFVNDLLKKNDFYFRNQKFSKYSNSFIELNESGLI